MKCNDFKSIDALVYHKNAHGMGVCLPTLMSAAGDNLSMWTTGCICNTQFAIYR